LSRLALATLSLLLLPLTAPAADAPATTDKPELVSVQKIWDAAPHNAFTDLIRFHDKWFCTFRESQAHVGGNGKIRLITSDDGDRWTSAALLAEDGVDLRDPKLSVTPDGRLMLVMGGSYYQGKKLLNRRPRVSFSPDGSTWTAPQPVLADGDWLWRVTWDDAGHAYGTSYRNNHGADWALTLYRTTDGLHYDKVTDLTVPDQPNETTLRVLADGSMMALVRREAGDQHGWVGTSPKPPYTEWSWHEIPSRLGGPNFLQAPDGSLWAAGRQYDKHPKMHLARLTPTTYDPLLLFPSGGDCSYPGMALHDDLLWISYYSSHEGKTSIYLAKVKLPTGTGKSE
jgi:hypothetical protein